MVSQDDGASPRVGLSACTLGGGAVLFGGADPTPTVYNELYGFDPATFAWGIRPPFQMPLARMHILIMYAHQASATFGEAYIGVVAGPLRSVGDAPTGRSE